jgi:hypothetical protein
MYGADIDVGWPRTPPSLAIIVLPPVYLPY